MGGQVSPRKEGAVESHVSARPMSLDDHHRGDELMLMNERGDSSKLINAS